MSRPVESRPGKVGKSEWSKHGVRTASTERQVMKRELAKERRAKEHQPMRPDWPVGFETMPEELAHQVFTILVKEAGAREYWRHDFVRYVGESHSYPHEYRFCGSLGFGGKFRIRRGAWVVDCYGEDETPERRATIDRTNAALAALREEERAR